MQEFPFFIFLMGVDLDALHIHLMFNHLPIFGVFCALVVLLIALISKNKTTVISAYILILIAGLGGIITHFSGENAEQIIKSESFYDRNYVIVHEASAEFAFFITVVILTFSLVGIILNFKKNKHASKFNYFMMIIAFGALTAYSRTAYLGGIIRHDELKNRTDVIPLER